MRGRMAHVGFGALFGLSLLTAEPAARAGFFVAPAAPPAGTAPAVQYGEMDRATCEAELGRRGVPFAPVDEARGVLAPVRLTGPLHGVTFRTGLPASQRASSPWEIVDCRLALALDDFAVQLEAHDIVTVIHLSIYRPPSSRWPDDKLASRHPGGLAMDAATFVKKDGTELEVQRDFHGRIGAKTCGAGAGPHPATPQANELRSIVCDAADARLFNVLLTPDYNWPHRNHFHLEVTAGAKWFVVH
ncbi:MAG TPA: extensin family protein [Polyangiaceae bacterium]